MSTSPLETPITSQLPALEGGRRVLFFGGSFDPPHLGHADLPRRVCVALGVPDALMVYVPAARSPLKDARPTAASHRVAMLGLQLASVAGSMVWTEEIERAARHPDQPSYWTETWETARAHFGAQQAGYLIGADQALSMHRWRDYESIWKDAVVMLRDEHDDPEQLIGSLSRTGVWSDSELGHWRSHIVRFPMMDISSTRIRQTLADTATRENPIAGLDDRVHDYILRHKLYLG